MVTTPVYHLAYGISGYPRPRPYHAPTTPLPLSTTRRYTAAKPDSALPSSGPRMFYATVLFWPSGPLLRLGCVPNHYPDMTISLLGADELWIRWSRVESTADGGVDIVVPAISLNKMPCSYAWVFKFTIPTV